MSKGRTVKMIGPRGQIKMQSRYFAEHPGSKTQGWSLYDEPKRKTFAPLVSDTEKRGPGRPKKETNTESDADNA